MSFKHAIAVGLLLFVAASIVTPMVRRSSGPRPHDATADAAPPPRDGVVVYYFRATAHCAACRTLEACSREVVRRRFATEAAGGRIEWRVIDYQSPGNEHYVNDYQLLTGGVVLVELRDGRPRRWKALPETWNMTGDGAELAAYLEKAIRAFQEQRR
jgi:hypothetical protein